MNHQKINISDLENDFPRFINRIMHGEEIILTKVDKPIAIISPFKFEESLKTRSKINFRGEEPEEVTERESTNSEWWIG